MQLMKQALYPQATTAGFKVLNISENILLKIWCDYWQEQNVNNFFLKYKGIINWYSAHGTCLNDVLYASLWKLKLWKTLEQA